jgi:NADPH2:quinone reductase
MQAAWYEENGAAAKVLKIGELASSDPGPGEVKVRLYASGVNPSDVKKRAGMREAMTARIIPHSDGAGIVDSVGAGVENPEAGDRVWVYNGQYSRDDGSAAEFIVLPVAQVFALADDMSFEAGACLGIPAMTAHRCLFSDGSIRDQTVLVTGGAGGVGHYAIQLARWGGARVITTVSGPKKAAHARSAGADVVLNYREDDIAARCRELSAGRGVDRIVDVDFGGNLSTSLAALATCGTIATYASMGDAQPQLPFYAMMFENVTVRTVLVYNMTAAAKAQAGQDINLAQSQGGLTHAIDSVHSLNAIAAAHERVESTQAIGNVIVTI